MFVLIKSIMYQKSVFIWIFSIIFSIDARTIELFEGNTCALHDGNFGVCKQLTQCNWVREGLINGTLTLNKIVQCGFSGFDSIVCCGDERRQPVADSGVTYRPNGSGIVFENDSNEISNTSEEQQFNVVPNRFSGKKIEEACQKYAKLAIPFSSDNILFGRPVSLTEYPHMAALGYPNDDGDHDFDCGGSLISEQWVVTAAHCAKPIRPPTLIRMGVTFLDNDDVSPVDRNVANITRHSSYSAESKKNDIALIQLDRPVAFNDYVRPACIRTQIEDVSMNTELIIIGWGSILASKNQRPEQLQQANVTIVSLASCNATFLKYNQLADQPSFRKGLIDSQLCALDTNSAPDKIKDACVGDSGGPIFTYNPSGLSSLVGVTSFGVSCGTQLPSVYTRIASFTEWIESIVWPN